MYFKDIYVSIYIYMRVVYIIETIYILDQKLNGTLWLETFKLQQITSQTGCSV